MEFSLRLENHFANCNNIIVNCHLAFQVSLPPKRARQEREKKGGKFVNESKQLFSNLEVECEWSVEQRKTLKTRRADLILIMFPPRNNGSTSDPFEHVEHVKRKDESNETKMLELEEFIQVFFSVDGSIRDPIRAPTGLHNFTA